MKVPLLDLQAHLAPIRDDIDAQIREVLDSCVFINGPKVSELEEAVADYCGVPHAIGVSSGTDALLVALMALGVGHGDIVLTTPYSFFATAGAVSRLGAKPVFVDIDASTQNLCPKKLGEWLDANPTERSLVKAILPVHLYGQCADMKPIMELARTYGFPVIEDAAQAIGSRYSLGEAVVKAGAIGDIGCFSFFPSKNLGGIGDGGMVTARDAELAERLRKLRNHGAHPKYYHELIGGNFRLDALQAAVLNAKLPHLEAWHQARQANARYYDERLKEVDGVQTPVIAQDQSFHIYNQYVVRAKDRDQLRQHLAGRGVATEVYYPVPFHKQKCFEYLGYSDGAFPQAEAAAASTVALPIYPDLTTEMQDFVIECIRDFYG